MSGLWIPALRIVGVAGETSMVLTVAGEVDVATVANLRRALADARAGFVTVILDLHNVWFFGAAGLKTSGFQIGRIMRDIQDRIGLLQGKGQARDPQTGVAAALCHREMFEQARRVGVRWLGESQLWWT